MFGFFFFAEKIDIVTFKDKQQQGILIAILLVATNHTPYIM